MLTIIDGHNLIPFIHGIDLGQIDDEERLIKLLQNYCRTTGQVVEVFFDGAPPLLSSSYKSGLLRVFFVRRGNTADDAIRRRLAELKGKAHNCRVVTSDRQVQSEAHFHHAQVVSSAEFASQLGKLAFDGKTSRAEREDSLSPQEVEEWLEIFKQKKKG